MTKDILKNAVRWLLGKLFQVELRGVENFRRCGTRTLMVVNHTSFLDAVLLWAFIPGNVTFAISSEIAQRWWVQPGLWFVPVFRMNPLQPMSIKSLTHFVQQGNQAVIFPEGRLTETGSLMKIYDGAGLIADKSQADVLPIRLEGTQYTLFSKLGRVARQRFFPRITVTVLAPRKLSPPWEVRGRERRKYAGRLLSDLMTEMMFVTAQRPPTLFAAILAACRVHGSKHVVLEDVQRQPLSYRRLIAGSLALGAKLAQQSVDGESVGLLLPNSCATVVSVLGLQICGRVPAMLNYSAGTSAMLSACVTASIKRIVTSRRFVEVAHLGETVAALRAAREVIYLEDVRDTIGWRERLLAWVRAVTVGQWYHPLAEEGNSPAVILFTSGSEGVPKGVVLSHANIIANGAQISARIPFTARDVVVNALPLFHAFGLSSATFLPLIYGMRTFLYVSPLHYRVVPEVSYDQNATVLFGTNTFLAGYGKAAHPYDFYSLRYVFAGAERVQDDTRNLWAEKFGLRILEGYGATETAPILTCNTPSDYRGGTTGRFLPGIEWRLEKVTGVSGGGRLHVSGPNVMLGYLRNENPGVIEPPQSNLGAGWYDTGDIVDVSSDGYVTILGRVKRFAKIAGEMVSLSALEDLSLMLFPDAQHAALALPDAKKGEQIVLLTTARALTRSSLLEAVRRESRSELLLPRTVEFRERLPLLGSGKIDYVTLQKEFSGSEA